MTSVSCQDNRAHHASAALWCLPALLLWLACATLSATAVSAPPAANPEPGQAAIFGSLRLLSDSGRVIEDRREFAHAVVYFEPDETPDLTPPEDPVIMTTRSRRFQPRVLVIVAGSKVQFPNEDPILHNVFSSSAGNQFDLGHYGRGPGDSTRFDSPGLVRVFCNVHSEMFAHIVVVNSHHFVVPDARGQWRLNNLPPGPGRLTIWHERAEPQRIRLELSAGQIHFEHAELKLTVRPVAPTRERFRRRGRY